MRNPPQGGGYVAHPTFQELKSRSGIFFFGKHLNLTLNRYGQDQVFILDNIGTVC